MRRLFILLAFFVITGQIFSQEFQLSDFDHIGIYSNEWDQCQIGVKKDQQGQISILVEVYPYVSKIYNSAYFVISPEYADAFISNVATSYKEFDTLVTNVYGSFRRDYRKKLELIPCRANIIYKPYDVENAFSTEVDLIFTLKVEDEAKFSLDIEVDKSFYKKTHLSRINNLVSITLTLNTFPMFAAILEEGRIDEYKKLVK